VVMKGKRSQVGAEIKLSNGQCIVRVLARHGSCLTALMRTMPTLRLLSLGAVSEHSDHYNSNTTKSVAHFGVPDTDMEKLKKIVEGTSLRCGNDDCGSCLLES